MLKISEIYLHRNDLYSDSKDNGVLVTGLNTPTLGGNASYTVILKEDEEKDIHHIGFGNGSGNLYQQLKVIIGEYDFKSQYEVLFRNLDRTIVDKLTENRYGDEIIRTIEEVVDEKKMDEEIYEILNRKLEILKERDLAA